MGVIWLRNILSNGEEFLKKKLELLEKKCFLRRFHRKVTPDK